MSAIYINIYQLNSITGIKVPTLRKWVHQKLIPYYKISGKVLFNEKEILDFFNQSKITPEIGGESKI